MIDEEKRLAIIFSVAETAFVMQQSGFPKTAYSKLLREAIFFVWEIREKPKHSKHRVRSNAAIGLPSSELDYDHAVPMRIVIEMILAAWPDTQRVEWIIRNLVRGVLITKDEHSLLRARKLSSQMPDDWDGKDWAARYREVGICLSSPKGYQDNENN